MARYRSGVGHVKRQHHIVPGLSELLDQLGALGGVDGIIPGRVRPLRKGSPPRLTFQYVTESGFKLLGHASGAVQEIFVVTRVPQSVRRRAVEAGIIESGSKDEETDSRATDTHPSTEKG